MFSIYQREVRHVRMNKFHVLRDKDPEVLRQKAEALMAQWEEMWQRKQERDREAGMKQLARDAQARNKEQKALLAETKTAEAEQEVRQLESVLKRVIGLDTEIHIGLDTEIQWDRLKDHLESLRKWEQERQKYNEERERRNKQVDQKRENYLNGDTSEIIDYCDMVLSSSEYPDYFPQNFDLDYIEETK